jgi:hypothetical protein
MLLETTSQRRTGVARVNVTVEPVIFVQIIVGSDPTLSTVVPPDGVVAVPGNVTGTGTLHALPSVVRDTDVMVLLSDRW